VLIIKNLLKFEYNLYKEINRIERTFMATLILRETHNKLIEEMKLIDKLKIQTSHEIKEAASHGDLKENYDYKAAKEKMNLILNKKELLHSYMPFEFVDFQYIGIEDVGFGNIVTIQEQGTDNPEEYYLLGPIEFELDLYPNIITYHSPFGNTIYGKKINDEFSLTIKRKETNFKIIGIDRIKSE
tara:strand:- start:900 stop:1454 length:555 start_codon:yes stop_codon:yes gene_type:complete